MILDIVKLAVGAGTHIMSNRQKRKMLESDAALVHAEKMAKGEIEYQASRSYNRKTMDGRMNSFSFSYHSPF